MPDKNTVDVICFKGADEICEYVREDFKQINSLVEYEDLPAFKRGGKGSWRALKIDLDMWLIEQRNKYIKNRKTDAIKNGVNT